MRRRLQALRDQGDRGAVIVEAAMILPILVVMVFGIIEYGLAFGDASSTATASRTGARRMSATWPAASDKLAEAKSVASSVAADLTELNAGEPISLWMYKAGANGLPSDSSCSSRCYKFTWDSSANNFVYSSGSWNDPDACGDTVDYVGVEVRVRHDFITGVFGKTKTLDEKTVMRLEPLPTDTCA